MENYTVVTAIQNTQTKRPYKNTFLVVKLKEISNGVNSEENKMTNIIQQLVKQYKRGYQIGYEDGYETGSDQSYECGYEDGRNDQKTEIIKALEKRPNPDDSKYEGLQHSVWEYWALDMQNWLKGFLENIEDPETTQNKPKTMGWNIIIPFIKKEDAERIARTIAYCTEVREVKK